MTLRLSTIGAGLAIAGICTFSAHAADRITSTHMLTTMLAATTTTFGDSGIEVTQGNTQAAPQPKPDAPAAAAPAPAAAPAATPATPSTAEKPAAAAGDDKVKYTIEPGNKVDEHTLAGWKTWRALDCARCHGANQQGLVGPSLIVAIQKLTKDEFKTTVLKGRLPQGMPPFESVPRLVKNIDNLYTYLKARSDGKLEPGHVYPLDK